MPGVGKILVGSLPGGVVARVEGRGTLQLSPTLEAFVASCLEQGHGRIVVDLTRCEYLDSTFLGCLLGLHRRCAGRTCCEFLVAAEPGRKRHLFGTTMLDRVLSCLDASPEPAGDLTLLSPTACRNEALGRHAAESHQRLAELGGPQAEAFSEIARQLWEELQPRGE